MRDLIEKPVWQPGELGQPMPPSLHAVSVALPRWQDVVGYEEKKPEVLTRLLAGYPRFKIHSLVLDLARQLGNGAPCLPFPSVRVAEECAQFIRRSIGAEARVVADGDVYGVVTNSVGQPALLTFWQHTGLIVSTRQAEELLGRGQRSEVRGQRSDVSSLRRRLGDLYGVSEDDVFLAPTGMASVFEALKAIQKRIPDQPTAQLGFPYVDSLKLQEKFGNGGILLHDLETAGSKLSEILNRQSLAGCFCEIPGNPLLGSVDLRVISPLLRKHRVPLVVDDVIATPINVDLSAYADLIATSLTKFIVGTCDAMGGALICNPKSPYFDELKAIIRAAHEELLWPEDAAVLAEQARTFPDRMKKHNENGLIIAERLRGHPAIERVWNPKWETAEAFEAVRRPNGGWGALLSFLPKNAAKQSQVIYDRLEVCKGPSLGAVFTLASPFTLLAHYTELDWAESCGVSRYLIRLSVGLEEPEELWGRIERALGA